MDDAAEVLQKSNPNHFGILFFDLSWQPGLSQAFCSCANMAVGILLAYH